MKSKYAISFILTIILSSLFVSGQNSVYRSLLSEEIMDQIIGEASGERAMVHIIEMGAYNHNRPADEYSGNFFETDYVRSELEKYGLDEITIDRYEGGLYWDGISGELWEVSPTTSKLADYGDLTAMLAQGSKTSDVKAQLVWVGNGTEEEILKAGVKGKIAVSDGSPRSVHNIAVKNGAVGIVSLNSPRPLKVSSAIPITGISGRAGSDSNETFGFFLPPREGEILKSRLLQGEEILVHAKVESQMLDYNLEVTSCLIPGRDPSAGEIIFSAHLFEGFVKQGANDNISGSAAILEIARMLKTMIDEGIIEQPLRGIRFIWVPEYSGTIPYVNANKARMEKTLCNINLDMVGLNLAENQSFLCMQRTTYGNPHYINDVMKNYFDFVGSTNRVALALSGRGGFTKSIVAPSGTDDPFYYSVDDHYGSSDHEVFNDPAVQVPGIMMITWPDLYYHTSQDRADKCDPTQLKRVCVIGAAAAYTIASAENEMALKIGSEVIGNSAERIGSQLQRASDLLDSSDKETFKEAWLKGYRYIEAAILNEKATLRTINELGIKDPASFIFNLESGLNEIGNNILSVYSYYSNQKASILGLGTPQYQLNREEKEASRISPKLSPKFLEAGYGAARSILLEAGDLSEKYPVSTRIDINEMLRLCKEGYNTFEIKIMLDAQMKSGETDLLSIVNTIKILAELGYLEI